MILVAVILTVIVVASCVIFFSRKRKHSANGELTGFDKMVINKINLFVAAHYSLNSDQNVVFENPYSSCRRLITTNSEGASPESDGDIKQQVTTDQSADYRYVDCDRMNHGVLMSESGLYSRVQGSSQPLPSFSPGDNPTYAALQARDSSAALLPPTPPTDNFFPGDNPTYASLAGTVPQSKPDYELEHEVDNTLYEKFDFS